tara:strand:+ start:13496 stop:14443 length:948 start_codon:yes stop_codon:yes gene_type:complete
MRKTSYDIHPDFARLPVITLKFGAVLLWLINAILKLQRFFARRALRVAPQQHRVENEAGDWFNVLSISPPGLPERAPALLYYHGGGFAMTYGGLHLQNCERYAIEAQCVVIFVDYRLAPKHPFPDAFDDCYRALEWTLEHAGTLGIDPQRIAVGGDSAGGAFAAGVAQKARDEQLAGVCAQLLIYPVLDNSCSTASATDFIDVPVWNAVSNRNMWKMYLRRYTEGETPPYAAPGRGKLQNLPPSYIETAEFDPLRDEGLNYATALRAQGTEVVLNETRQTVHGFDAVAKSTVTANAMQERIAFLRGAFHDRPDSA